MRRCFFYAVLVVFFGIVGCGGPQESSVDGTLENDSPPVLKDVEVVKDGVVPKSPPIQESDLDAPDPFQVVGGVPVYEVKIGDSLEDVRKNCEIFNETFYPKLNRRLLKIKTKEPGASCINVYFINEDVVTQFEILYEEPSMANADIILAMLKKRYGCEDKESRSDETTSFNYIEIDVQSPSDTLKERHSYHFSDRDDPDMKLSISGNHFPSVPDTLHQEMYDSAKKLITECLKCPSTATFQPINDLAPNDFCSVSRYAGWHQSDNTECRWITKGLFIFLWCEAENSYGAPIRSDYKILIVYENGKQMPGNEFCVETRD